MGDILRYPHEIWTISQACERLRKKIERLPIDWRDLAIAKAIRPFLGEGKGITPRRVVELGETIPRRLVKQYFQRLGYECYTDEELWIRRRGQGGHYAKEEYPIPDVFAKKPTEIVVAEVKDNTSAKSTRDCIRKVREYLKFTNRVYAAFPLSSRPSGSKGWLWKWMKNAPPDVGLLLLVDDRRRDVEELYAAKEHSPSNTKKFYEYYYLFDQARARHQVGVNVCT
jgi:Holliday junction resolvase